MFTDILIWQAFVSMVLVDSTIIMVDTIHFVSLYLTQYQIPSCYKRQDQGKLGPIPHQKLPRNSETPYYVQGLIRISKYLRNS